MYGKVWADGSGKDYEVMELLYKYLDAFDEAKHRTEMESVTMPQTIEGAPSSDVRAVLGVMDERDHVFVRASLGRAASAIFPALRIALDKTEGIEIMSEGADNGVEFKFASDRVRANDTVVLGVNLKTALLYYILYEWFTMFPQRHDIADKYVGLYDKSVHGIKRSIIQ